MSITFGKNIDPNLTSLHWFTFKRSSLLNIIVYRTHHSIIIGHTSVIHGHT